MCWIVVTSVESPEGLLKILMPRPHPILIKSESVGIGAGPRHQYFFLNKFIYLFVFIFGCVGSLLWCAGFSLRWFLLLRSMGSRHVGFSSCGSRAQ